MQNKKDVFLEFVISEAEKLGKIFILDSGEGRDYLDPITGWDVEDLSGWLIDKNQKEKLLKDRNNNIAHRTFSKRFVFVKWNKKDNGQITIDFLKY